MIKRCHLFIMFLGLLTMACNRCPPTSLSSVQTVNNVIELKGTQYEAPFFLLEAKTKWASGEFEFHLIDSKEQTFIFCEKAKTTSAPSQHYSFSTCKDTNHESMLTPKQIKLVLSILNSAANSFMTEDAKDEMFFKSFAEYTEKETSYAIVDIYLRKKFLSGPQR